MFKHREREIRYHENEEIRYFLHTTQAKKLT